MSTEDKIKSGLDRAKKTLGPSAKRGKQKSLRWAKKRVKGGKR